MHLFADDTQLYVCFDLYSAESAAAVIKIEDCIKGIRIWMTQNKLKLNNNKTERLFITPSQSNQNRGINKTVIGESDITSKRALNLVVIFYESMSMKDHIKLMSLMHE